MKLRILLADDHTVVREGLAMLINAQPDMAVVAQAGSGREAIRLAGDARPDIAVLDVTMPNTGGADAAREMLAICPDTRVLALTRHADQGYVRAMLAAGAKGYVLKQSAAGSLVEAIRTIAQGGTYVEPGLVTDFIDRAIGSRRTELLTPREHDVLRRVAWGRSNKEIAAELGLSVKTVESYKATASHKLKLRSRSDIVRYALSQGWLTEE